MRKNQSMDLDHGACYRAVVTRDGRFDGLLFTGVRTTGIYCRPICPARTPRPENVDERHGPLATSFGPTTQDRAHRAAYVRRRGAGVDEERLLFAEDQIQERLLEIRAPGLAEDEEVPVVLVDAEFGRSRLTRGIPIDPRSRKHSWLQLRGIRLQSLRLSGQTERRAQHHRRAKDS